MTPTSTSMNINELQHRIDPAHLPRHIAVIMDGNGRWAKKRGLPRLLGHRAGTESVTEIVRVCGEIGIEVLTLYAFSTENWRRPVSEVSGLMDLLCMTLRKKTGELLRNNVRVRVIGRPDAFSQKVRDALDASMAQTARCTGLILNLALNYGSRREIVDAVNALIPEGKKTVTEDDLAKHLYTAGLPDPDLLIRTSGEMRISNFLLWQTAYAELVFTPVLWPSFRRKHLLQAILEYQARRRRYGGL